MGSMSLNVLLLTRQQDEGTLLDGLRQEGFAPAGQHVESEEAYLRALENQTPELILAGDALPGIDATHALTLLNERRLDIPCIVVANHLDGGSIVRWLKLGAASCLWLDQLDQLGDIVKQALAEQRDRVRHRAAEAARRIAEERYRSIADLATDFACSFVAQPDGTLIRDWLTDGFTAITGFSRDALVTWTDWIDLIHPDDQAAMRRHLSVVEGGKTDTLDVRLLTGSSEVRWITLQQRPVLNATGRLTRIYGAARDSTERRLAEEETRRRALHDPLTSLPNRNLLGDRLRQAILAVRRDVSSLALLLIDLRRFKEIIATFGYAYSELLLQQAGARMAAVLRDSDTVARLGGDQFAVLLPGADVAAATRIAGKIHAAIGQPYQIESHTLQVKAAIGIALYPQHGETAETLLRRAEVAMYAAKAGADGTTLYSAEMDRASQARLELIGELRSAIESDELLLYYQPIAETLTGRLAGVEALLRWPHPREGLLLPDRFVPLAEQAGLIGPLTHWALNAALHQCAAWSRQGLEIDVAANLSARSLHDPHLAASVAGLLDTWGVPPARLTLEIAEAAIMTDLAAAMALLDELHTRGIRLAIDDFGTGHSSLVHLQRLPVQAIKIDRPFIKQLDVDADGAFLVRSTISLGHSLGRQVIAEGVEDEHIWQTLASMHCDLLQGYLLARPMPATEIVTWADQPHHAHRPGANG